MSKEIIKILQELNYSLLPYAGYYKKDNGEIIERRVFSYALKEYDFFTIVMGCLFVFLQCFNIVTIGVYIFTNF